MKTKMILACVFFLIILTACSTPSSSTPIPTSIPLDTEPSSPTPIPTSIPLDTDGDGMITLEELRVTVETMRKLVGAIEAEKPELAAKLSAEISVYEEALTNPFLLELSPLLLTANELLTAINEINLSR